MTKRKIIVNIATSADGYIARADIGICRSVCGPTVRRFSDGVVQLHYLVPQGVG